jgi:hypothetical protein
MASLGAIGVCDYRCAKDAVGSMVPLRREKGSDLDEG